MEAWSQINVINGGKSFTCQTPGHPVLPMLGSVAQTSKFGGGKQEPVKKLFHTFVKQTNKSTWQREKGRVGDDT